MICNKCDVDKPLSDFCANRKNKSGCNLAKGAKHPSEVLAR